MTAVGASFYGLAFAVAAAAVVVILDRFRPTDDQ